MWMPETESVPEKLTVTVRLYQPFASGPRSGFAFDGGCGPVVRESDGSRADVACPVGAVAGNGRGAAVRAAVRHSRRAGGDPGHAVVTGDLEADGWLYQPSLSGPRWTAIRTPGGDPSFLTLTVDVTMPSGSDTWHDTGVPPVSCEMVVAPQPWLHETVTACRCHSEQFAGPGEHVALGAGGNACEVEAVSVSTTSVAGTSRSESLPLTCALPCARSDQDEQQARTREREREERERSQDHRVRRGLGRRDAGGRPRGDADRLVPAPSTCGDGRHLGSGGLRFRPSIRFRLGGRLRPWRRLRRARSLDATCRVVATTAAQPTRSPRRNRSPLRLRSRTSARSAACGGRVGGGRPRLLRRRRMWIGPWCGCRAERLRLRPSAAASPSDAVTSRGPRGPEAALRRAGPRSRPQRRSGTCPTSPFTCSPDVLARMEATPRCPIRQTDFRRVR